jgi:hypothetical protein
MPKKGKDEGVQLNEETKGKLREFAQRIHEEGPKIRIDPTKYFELLRYSEQVTGLWWQKVKTDDPISLSCFRLELDEEDYHLRLVDGKSFDQSGSLVAHWESVLSEIDLDQKKLVYHWKGWWEDRSNLTFHGYGELNFTGDGGGVFDHGFGRFWEINELNPEKTKIKTTEVRRVKVNGMQNAEAIKLLNRGPDRMRRLWVLKAMADW